MAEPRGGHRAQPNRSDDERSALVTVVGRVAPHKPAAHRSKGKAGHGTARECGPCRVCCRLPDIPELDKPINTWCRHIDLESGAAPCKIYDHRPGVCRAFDCAWKQGLGGSYDRPDILGVMWQTVTMPDGQPGLGVIEAKDGALLSSRVRRQLREFESKKPGRIIIRRAHEPRFSPVSVLIEGKPLGAVVKTRKRA